jgi:sigma-B regulation protein RsbU (phosphoserine phosphatase)
VRESIIQRVPLFASLPHDEIQHLAATLRAYTFAPGILLLREGEYGDRFYIIAAGEVEIIKALGTPEEHRIGLRGPGEYVGEMSLFNRDGLRTASARTRTAVQTLEMTRSDFDALLHRQPTLAYEMVRVLSMRLTQAHDSAIRDLQEKNRQLAEAYEELKAAQAQIIEKEKLERELELARRIQMSIFPHGLPQFAGFDFGAQVIPMSAVGGDLFDLIPLDDDRLGIAVGDVSGHGVPAALFMALTVTLLRAEACRTCSPQEVLRSVNRQLLNLGNRGVFVTMLYGVLDRATREFTYVRAGHEAPLLCRANGDLLIPALGRGQLLGFFDNPLLPEETVQLASGDTMLLYTDGVIEAVDAQDQMFGEEQLHETFNANCDAAPQVMCDRILERVANHSGSLSQRDDITLVCVQAK